MRRVDNEAATQWTTNIGDNGGGKFSVGYSVIEVRLMMQNRMTLTTLPQGASALYVGIGLWQSSSSKQMPAVVALNPSTGAVLWTKVLTSSNHGGVRSCIMDNTDIVCAGYINYGQKGQLGVGKHRRVLSRRNCNLFIKASCLLLMRASPRCGDSTATAMF